MTGFLESQSWLPGSARILCNDIGRLHRDDLLENLYILPEDRRLRLIGVSQISSEHVETRPTYERNIRIAKMMDSGGDKWKSLPSCNWSCFGLSLFFVQRCRWRIKSLKLYRWDILMQFGCETARQLWHHMLSKYLLPYWRLLAGQLVLAAKIGRTGKNYEKLRRPKVSLSHSMPWCHVLHNEVGGFLIATPAYLDDGHVIPCDLEAVWVEGPRSVPQLDLAGLLPFWDLKGTGHLSVSFFSGPKCGLLENRIPPKFTKNQ